MKIFKYVLLFLLLMVVFSACSLSAPAPITNSVPMGSVATMTMPVNSTPTRSVVIIPTYIAPTPIASPISTLVPPNMPIWSVYNYTCELAVGGGMMTMNLAWFDRSDSEEGFRVYRDGQVIATLAPNSTFYVDTAFVVMGKTLSYSVEAFTADWQLSTNTIIHGCQ